MPHADLTPLQTVAHWTNGPKLPARDGSAKARKGPVGAERESHLPPVCSRSPELPPRLPRRPPPSLNEKKEGVSLTAMSKQNSSTSSPSLRPKPSDSPSSLPPSLPPRQPKMQVPAGRSSPGGRSPSKRPHSTMWLPSSEANNTKQHGSSEDLAPPFPIPPSLQPSSEATYYEREELPIAAGKKAFPNDPFDDQDPFASGTPSWHDPTALYDTPRPSIRAPPGQPRSESVKTTPVAAARHQRRNSDPCVGDIPLNLDGGQPTHEEVTLASQHSLPTTSRSSEKLPSHSKAAEEFASFQGNPQMESLKLFPSVDEIEEEILKKHKEKAESSRAPPLSADGKELSLSGVFDDPKYYKQAHIDAMVERMKSMSPDLDSTGTDEFTAGGYDIPLELIQRLRSERFGDEKNATTTASPPPQVHAPPSSPVPPPLPDRTPAPKMMTVVASPQPLHPGPPLPEKNVGSNGKQSLLHTSLHPTLQSRPPVAAPRVARAQESELPPLPPRNAKARSASPQPPDQSDVLPTTSKQHTLGAPAGSKEHMRQEWRREMLHQGYTDEVVQRALTVAGEDLELGERILKAFGAGGFP